jgi:two-component system chemotaxis sensor kinase CheA
MIRNAVDHGLEDAGERAKTSKNPVGTILLRASHKGNSMCIEISDDGRGMDADKIASIAVKKGVITEEQSLRMTEKEKLNLIFLPGFSTAQKVTGLSGRGVGMDVVRSMIASFNGVVDITTKMGEGSTFVLKIPLTLAIIQALLVVIGGEVYALPLDAVTEIIKVPKKDIYSVDGNSTVKLRNHALSLIELEKVIKVKPNRELNEDHKRLVIITDGENRLGVEVDSLVGKDEIVIKSFTKHFSRVKGVIGASILADGNVALILDPATIIKESR